jgi:hypothetical protein
MPSRGMLGGAGTAYCSWRERHLPVLTQAGLELKAASHSTPPARLAVVDCGVLAPGMQADAASSISGIVITTVNAAHELLSTMSEPNGIALSMLNVTHSFARLPGAEFSREARSHRGGSG